MAAVDVRRGRNAELFARAERVLPGATFGTFQLPREQAMVVARGSGPRIWDVDGNEYIDYVLGSGPLILGHAHPAVVEAVKQQIEKGSTFYGLNEPAIELAETIVDAVPCGEAVKFVSTGTEATFHALRMARAFTGRPNVLKFSGGFHGVHDYALMTASPEGRRVPESGGIPEPVQETVFVAPFNDADAAVRMIEANAATLAAVILEPLQRVIRPAPGFLQAIRDATQRHGVVLVYDEVVTGFRLAYGGAQEYYGVVPDLATYGKAISGGYPLAAVCGRHEIVSVTDPSRRGTGAHSAIGGTLSGNPVAAVAGLATLRELKRPGTHERIFATGRRLMDGMTELGRQAGLPVQVVGEPPVFQVFFTEHPIRSHEDTAHADTRLGWVFGTELVKRGLFHTPGFKFYVSAVHGEREIADTLEAVEGALRAVKEVAA